MQDNCSPGTAVAAEQAVVEADQKRQELVPGKLVAGHIPGTAEVVGVQSADYSLLNTEYHTVEAAEVEPAAAAHHSRPVAGTVGTSDLKKKNTHIHTRKQDMFNVAKRNIFKIHIHSLSIQTE